MARYIDADKLIEKYENAMSDDWNKRTSPSSWSDAYDCVIADIDDMPTADVVPKSEVEKIFEEIEKIRAKEIHKCEILRAQENEASERKYWEGGEHSLRQLSYWIAELKKKYTEKTE